MNSTDYININDSLEEFNNQTCLHASAMNGDVLCLHVLMKVIALGIIFIFKSHFMYKLVYVHCCLLFRFTLIKLDLQ